MLKSNTADGKPIGQYRVKVMLATALPFEGGVLDYLMDAEHPPQIGQTVIAPLGNRSVPGVIVGLSDDDPLDKRLKPLDAVSDLPDLSPDMLDTLRWVAGWTMAPVGAVLKMVLPIKDALLPPKGQMAWRPAPDLSLEAGITEKRRAVLMALQDAPPMTMRSNKHWMMVASRLLFWMG